MIAKFRRFMKGRRGQGMTEYIIIGALIAIAALVLFTIFGDQIRSITGGIVNSLSGTQEGATRQTVTDVADQDDLVVVLERQDLQHLQRVLL